jgi:TPR repeat protein
MNISLLLLLSAAALVLVACRVKTNPIAADKIDTKIKSTDIESDYRRASRYLNGAGLAKDQKEAVKWYRKAAEQNYAAAQYNLGLSYYSGTGVTKDDAEAVKLVSQGRSAKLR